MTEVLRLFAFNCGWFQCRPGYFIEGDEGDYLRGPVPSYLIDHPKGRALFDTGMGARYRRDCETALPANKFGLQWFEGMDIAARLRAIDVDPTSIDWIVNSHLHVDHCGGNVHFPNATAIVQAREFAVACDRPEPGLYDALDFDTGQPMRTIEGEFDLFGDGSVRIVPTYGHTPGHQSVIVKLTRGDVLLAGDCCYTERNLDTMVLPKATADIEQGRLTLERLSRMRAAGTRILFGHDGRQWATIRENARFE
ncbi:N-acyl homoserine lactonase family protein [Novosphingobium sp. FKTRR1]|uniref:N-acyl homoserine lactonase family protein n=1 Tax=Novosphingobium sp. FKTRR1 TaxID=2879118 RepID=UPI001CF0557F|nr:N-acyl homoserine lactonase family protein [Novosphingobium sp. FKTRR1]